MDVFAGNVFGRVRWGMYGKTFVFTMVSCFILFLSFVLRADDAAYTDLGADPVTDPASINITGKLSLTSSTDVNDPAETPSIYPIYSGDIVANGIEIISSTGVWPPSEDPENSPKAQGLSGNLTLGAGGITVNKGTMLNLTGNVTFTTAATITIAVDSSLLGNGTITAGGDISIDQTGAFPSIRRVP